MEAGTHPDKQHCLSTHVMTYCMVFFFLVSLYFVCSVEGAQETHLGYARQEASVRHLQGAAPVDEVAKGTLHISRDYIYNKAQILAHP